MSTIKTASFGDIEYIADEIIRFEKGIPGFEKENEFIIIKPEEENPLVFMQSLNSPNLMFSMADPFAFFPDYAFNIDELSINELKIEAEQDVSVWGILSVPEAFQETTINLRAPIIINMKNKKAKQVILNDSTYITRTPLFPHLQQKGGE